MDTPIVDFLNEYASDPRVARLHMPGHKGRGVLGVEPFDVTEIAGADVLFCPEGIIAHSEANATALFGTQRTYYACGGSSQCIFTAMWLLRRYAADTQRAPLVLAARQPHQAFISALAQTGLEAEWFCAEDATALSCPVRPETLRKRLETMPALPVAFYVTSPDYLGNLQPIAEIAAVCHKLGVLLVVDNAHGAYLHFLPTPLHPLDAGADICCDSAHKTLSALTGAAYLHIGKECPAYFARHAKDVMLTVASTSPSYLTMASLDALNARLCDPTYREQFGKMASAVDNAKRFLSAKGWRTVGQEPLKITLFTPSMGYVGTHVAQVLSQQKIVVEFADKDYVVLMISADTKEEELSRAIRCLSALSQGNDACASLAMPPIPPREMSVREAYLAPRQTCPIDACTDKTLAFLRVMCPPAVPPVVAGERLTAPVVAYLKALGYTQLEIVK